MKKIILTTAAFLFAAGMAFAGSDHFGADFVPDAGSFPTTTHAMMSGGALDQGVTKSITDSAAGSNATSGMPASGYGQGIWGH
ncbi:hypothetical protein [Mesorhizobium erdmanii]|uniref:DUF680 domain-containing protein n=1 Tax=Mesorhizobium erdmanii TaxID=1777866 RepID=A0A6M7UIE6_9HYPH|nr:MULTISPECIES: hypothetical protein [Mesorhizobium]OBQ71030.1 hypothetical protein A8146_26600 [Mesorhizobium loti]QKC76546.1 hypothetical protein EB233_14265 [Mesorhizobium erdmanii]